MDKKIIFNCIQDIFRDIFDEESLIIDFNTSPEDIENWDSLNHILLLNSVQEEFNIRIDLEEMQLINDVSALIKIINNKI